MLGWFKKKNKKKDEQVHIEETSSLPEKGDQIEAVLSREEPKPKQDKKSFSERLREGLSKTREGFVARVDSLLLGRKTIDPELFQDLEEVLITADLGVRTTQDLLEKARTQVKRQELSDPKALKGVLQESILEYLHITTEEVSLPLPEKRPFVIMVVGVNGVGKTTTIGKIAHKFKQSGQSVLLVAADTFRAAAVNQLKIWGERSGVEVVAKAEGADPSSVVYDGLEIARENGNDVVIVDTAGRLHTSSNLMEELTKIKRVMAKIIPDAPHEVLLVLDATTGQNGVSQVKLFNEAVGITGLALTKLDGTAKGGIVVNICHEFHIPIRFIGIGEQMEDLRDFDSQEFIEALFGINGQ